MTRAILALGSNLGDRAGNLRAALALLAERGVQVERTSAAWETRPVPADQPAFLNAVLAAETALGPEALLAVAKEVEGLLGRRPARRWGPRPIDIDILFFGALQLDTPSLIIPHPGIRERSFVLAPLSEVAPGPLPVLGATALELLAQVDMAGAVRTGERIVSRRVIPFADSPGWA